MFQTMLEQIAQDTLDTVLQVQIVHELPSSVEENYRNMRYSGGELADGLRSPLSGQGRPVGEMPKQEPVRAAEKIGRNDPCPCGSGKKYKNCCGANQ